MRGGRPTGAGFTTRRPVAVAMVFLAAVVFGFFAYRRLPLTLMPELTYPTLTVRTEYPGTAPEEVENEVSRPIEEALGVIGGLRKISSVSRAGVSDVVLELAWDTDMSEATQDVLEKLDLVFLPEAAERPLILHYDPSLDPVMELSLSGRGQRFTGEGGLRRLRRLADLEIKRQLEPIKGVAAVRVRGGLEEEIHVLLEEDKLNRSDLAIQAVIDRLRQENVNMAGGTIQEGRTEYMVRTLNEYQDLRQIGDTVVARLDGRDVRVADLGRVVRTHKERQIVTRTDGGESVQIDLFKEGDANIVELAKRVRERLGEGDPRASGRAPPAALRPAGAGEGLAARLYREEGAVLQVVADRSRFIESSIREVRNTAIFGGLLAILVLFVFLRNAWSTLIVGLSIPISLFLTFAPMHLAGVSLNIMSLGGLALGIGMLVDSSIVVLESISRCREEGDGVEAAAVRGTAEVRGAVVASTLTSIAVFFPMVFVEGIAGQAFGDLGLAVVISLLASLVVAIFLIPMLASRRGVGRVGVARRRRGLPFESSLPRQVRLLRRFSAAGRRRGGRWVWVRLPLRAARRDLWPATAAVVSRDLRRLRRWWRRRPSLRLPAAGVAGLYLVLVRAPLGGAVEIAGRLLLTGPYLVLVAWRRLLEPVVAPAGRVVGGLPLRLVGRGLRGLDRAYPRLVGWALRHSLAMVAATVAILALTGMLFAGLTSELLPEVHQREFTVEAALPVGTPLERTEALLGPVGADILADRGAIRSMILTLGFDPATSERSDEGEHTARFKVLLDSAEPAVEEAVARKIRRRLAAVPDLEARVVRPVLFSSETPIEVEIHGDDLDRLRDQAARAREVMATLPELADVETTQRAGAPEVEIVYDRDRLALYGLNARQIAEQVRNQVQGFEATRFNRKDRRIPIVVRLGEEDRETVEDIGNLEVNPGGERPIPLAAVAAVRLGEGPSEVRRVDGRRVALVRANIASGSLGGAVERTEAALRDRLSWPEGMSFLLTGQNEEWERSRGSLWLALGLSIFLVYVIMAAQFESLLHPLVILFTIPLAFFGTALALDALGISLSIVVFLGMIMLAGIVVNNAIVLVDYINTLRRRGLPRDEAIVAAGRVRLRPILMTTATTVLGLSPMALGIGDGAEIRTPMAIAVVSGLVTSTVLTLLVIPSIYAVFERLRERLTGRSGERDAGGMAPLAEDSGEPRAEEAPAPAPGGVGS